MLTLYYTLYKPIRFYHTTTLCPLFKEMYKLKSKNNEDAYEIEIFENIKDAIDAGYYHPCPICAEFKTYKILLKVDARYFQFVLSKFDILILLLLYTKIKKDKGYGDLSLFDKPFRYIFVKIVKLYAAYGLINQSNYKYRFSDVGYAVIAYILLILKYSIAQSPKIDFSTIPIYLPKSAKYNKMIYWEKFMQFIKRWEEKYEKQEIFKEIEQKIKNNRPTE